MSNALILNNGDYQISLQHDQIASTAGELMKFHPAYKQIKDKHGEGAAKSTMMEVAVMSMLHGANPLASANEIYVWMDWQGQVTVYLGIAFLRRKILENDGVCWVWEPNTQAGFGGRQFEPRSMTADERARYDVNSGDAAYICRGYRSSAYERSIASGMPWQVAQQVTAHTGVGIVRHDEMFAKKDTRYKKKGDPMPPPNGRTWAWVAAKRAERDLLMALSPVAANKPHDVKIKPVPAQSTDEANNRLFGFSDSDEKDDTVEADYEIVVSADDGIIPEDDLPF